MVDALLWILGAFVCALLDELESWSGWPAYGRG